MHIKCIGLTFYTSDDILEDKDFKIVKRITRKEIRENKELNLSSGDESIEAVKNRVKVVLEQMRRKYQNDKIIAIAQYQMSERVVDI